MKCIGVTCILWVEDHWWLMDKLWGLTNYFGPCPMISVQCFGYSNRIASSFFTNEYLIGIFSCMYHCATRRITGFWGNDIGKPHGKEGTLPQVPP